jgi:hypothetical protein
MMIVVPTTVVWLSFYTRVIDLHNNADNSLGLSALGVNCVGSH